MPEGWEWEIERVGLGYREGERKGKKIRIKERKIARGRYVR